VSVLNDPQIERNVHRLKLPFDEFGFDPFGISREHLIKFYSPFAQLYRRYLKVTTFGYENIPREGRALLIGNHSGGVGADAAMVMTSMLLYDDNPRLCHGMAEYFFASFPFASQLLQRAGHLTGLPEHAERLLAAERLVVAFPEGARGALKPYRDRYKLTRFGTGFMRLALKMRAPIIPFAFIGGEEAFPILAHIDWVAKLVDAPSLTYPLSPQVVLWPLPVACQIYYGEAMIFEGDGSEPDEVIAGYVAQVKVAIETLIRKGLAARPSAFSFRRMPGPKGRDAS